MIICKKCGTENPDNAESCKTCGGSLTSSGKSGETGDDIYETFMSARVRPVRHDERRTTSAQPHDGAVTEPGFTPRSKAAGAKRSAGSAAAAFLKRSWKWLLPVVAVFIAAVVIIASVLSAKPDYGLLAMTPEYVMFSLADPVADGALVPVGLMDSSGNVILEADYQSILGEVEDGIFAVIGKNSKIGAVNAKGKEIISFDYLAADVEIGFSDGLWAVESSEGWGFVDKNGREKIDFEFAGAKGFSDGLAAVYDGELWGYINKSGKLVIDYEFEDASYFDGGMARICKDGKYGFIDKNGDIVVKPEFDAAYPYYQNGLCLVKVGNRYGFIDEKGEYAINPQFDDALPFSQGLAAVRLEDKIGYIDTDGKYVIKPSYDGSLTAESMFYEGYAVVYNGDTAIVIDKNGKQFVGTRFRCSYLSHLHDGFFVACVDGKYGIISAETGDFVLDPSYDELAFGLRDAAVFRGASEDVSVFVDSDGNVIRESGSELKEVHFFSSATPKTVAVALWCEERN